MSLQEEWIEETNENEVANETNEKSKRKKEFE